MSHKNICVFCSARDVEQKYHDLAAECGRIIAQHDLTLVYGGASSGLMREISDSAHTYGAEVIGVFPEFMHGLEILNNKLDTTIFVQTMGERKMAMIENSDSFLVLPGGFGTLDEFFEVLTMKVLGQIHSPIIIINYDGFWDSLVSLCNEIMAKNFARENAIHTFQVVSNLTDAFAILGVK